MTPVDQEFLHTEATQGDCLRAATASLLGVPLESVPHFVADNPGEGSDWYFAWEDWLREQGWLLVLFPGDRSFECNYLAAGKTERGTHHIVVMNDGEMVHDPHPSRAGLLSVSETYLLSPVDAEAMKLAC